MERNTIKNIIITNGIMLGLAGIIVSVIKYGFSSNYTEKNAWEQILGIALMIGFIYYSISTFKKKNENLLSISQALKIGLGVTIISSLFTILYVYLFSNFIEPDFSNKILELQIQEMEKANTPKETIETSINMMKNYMMPIMYFSIIMVSLIIGLITSLIIGAVLKKENNFQ
ncbi:MAG: DUF4199 domain-containing protein [Flavobacteriaceae bacterium]